MTQVAVALGTVHEVKGWAAPHDSPGSSDIGEGREGGCFRDNPGTGTCTSWLVKEASSSLW